MDPRFKVEVIAQMADPQRITYAAMHQDYSEKFVYDEMERMPDEREAGELIVKYLLNGNRGHYGCYSSDTEVLTDLGWVPWPDVTSGMNLLAVDISTGISHFEKPSALQSHDFVPGDKMYSVRSQYIDLLVTRDHRMVVSSMKKDGSFSEWRIKTASEVHLKPVRYLLGTCLDDEDREMPEDLPDGIDILTAFKLAGFFFGDGVRTQNKTPGVVRFRLRRPRKIAYLMSLGLNVNPKAGDRYTIENKSLAAWIHRNFSTSTSKTIPRWILKLPMNAISAFWDGLKNSDGTRVTDKSWAYDSCDKESLDLIQAVAHLNGFSANMTLSNKNEGIMHENHRPCWRITISERITKRVEVSQKGRSPGVKEELIDYEGKVYCASVSTGTLLVRRNGKAIVCGNCLEHPQLVLNFGYFPHSVMQQVRTHRNVSFDVQSGRYTSKRILAAANGTMELEDVFYLRPVGSYSDRQGKKYEYTLAQRQEDLEWCLMGCKRYAERIHQGLAEEHARGLIPFDVRQHWVMSGNARAIMHLLDIRGKFDVQPETRVMTELMFEKFKLWMPEVGAWYEKNRWRKGTLAP